MCHAAELIDPSVKFCCVPAKIGLVQLFPDSQTALASTSLLGKHTPRKHHCTLYSIKMCVCVCVWTTAGSLCVRLCTIWNSTFPPAHSASNLTGNSIACSSHLSFSSSLACSPITDVNVTPSGALTLCLGVHLVSATALLTGVCTMATTYVHETVASSGIESALNRNIAAILFSFHSLLIILLAGPIQEWPDKSAAQWRARWRGSSGVWMALACMMFQRAVALFSVV